MTQPDLTPRDPRTDRTRLVEGALISLIVVVAVVVGVPEAVDSVREGSLDLGAVFYPVILGAVLALAWARRTPQ